MVHSSVTEKKKKYKGFVFSDMSLCARIENVLFKCEFSLIIMNTNLMRGVGTENHIVMVLTLYTLLPCWKRIRSGRSSDGRAQC